jgi:hypothetical protein
MKRRSFLSLFVLSPFSSAIACEAAATSMRIEKAKEKVAFQSGKIEFAKIRWPSPVFVEVQCSGGAGGASGGGSSI